MNTRRNFLKGAAALSAATLFSPKWLMAYDKKAIGLQLYTLRKQMGKDVAGTLKAVAALGYKEVELAGYAEGLFYGMQAKTFANLLSQYGLTTPSGHVVPTDQTIDQLIEDSLAVGHKYIVYPWVKKRDRKLDFYKQLVEKGNRWGEKAKSAGLKFCYHNHDFEFEKEDGIIPYFDIFLKDSDPTFFNFEMDLYWVSRAGFDPVEIFEKYPGRFTMWHVKDMDDSRRQRFTEVGNGVIDFKRIFAKAETAGMQHFFVEQDKCRRNSPLESIEISINNLKKIV